MTGFDVRGVHKSYGDHRVLRGVDLTIETGSLTAILGASGSGKTTLLRILAGFERADSGTITMGDRVVDDGHRHLAPERRRVGYVPQEGALFPHLSVAGNVAFGLDRAARRGERVSELLELVGLGDLGHRYPHQLSGGQQQRVALARALAINPAIVLLDEPFSSLDAALRASVRADVVTALRTAGATALLVTHDQDEALSMADRVAVLRDGVIAQIGAPQQLYDRPADVDLAGFSVKRTSCPVASTTAVCTPRSACSRFRADRRWPAATQTEPSNDRRWRWCGRNRSTSRLVTTRPAPGPRRLASPGACRRSTTSATTRSCWYGRPTAARRCGCGSAAPAMSPPARPSR